MEARLARQQWDTNEPGALRTMLLMDDRTFDGLPDYEERPPKQGRLGGQGLKGGKSGRHWMTGYRSGRCYNCDEPGHRAFDCPNAASGSRATAFPEAQRPPATEPARSEGDGDVRMGEPFSFADVLRGATASDSSSSAGMFPPNPFGGQPPNGTGVLNPGIENRTQACTPGSQEPPVTQRTETTSHETAPTSNPTSAFGVPRLPPCQDPPSQRAASPAEPAVPFREPIPASSLDPAPSTGTSVTSGRMVIHVPGEGVKSEEEYDEWIRAKRMREAEQLLKEKMAAEKDQADREKVRAITERLEAFRERHRVEVAEAEEKMEKEFLIEASTIMLERKRYQYSLRLVDLEEHMSVQVALRELEEIQLRRDYIHDVQLMYQYFVFGLLRAPLPAGWKHTWAPDPIRPAIIPTLPLPMPIATIQPHLHSHPSVLFSRQLAQLEPDNSGFLPKLSMPELEALRKDPPKPSPNFMNLRELQSCLDSDDEEENQPIRRPDPATASSSPAAIMGPQPAPDVDQPPTDAMGTRAQPTTHSEQLINSSGITATSSAPRRRGHIRV